MQVVTPVAVDPSGRVAHSVALGTEAKESTLSTQQPKHEQQQEQQPCQQAHEECHCTAWVKFVSASKTWILETRDRHGVLKCEWVNENVTQHALDNVK